MVSRELYTKGILWSVIFVTSHKWHGILDVRFADDYVQFFKSLNYLKQLIYDFSDWLNWMKLN